MSTVSNFCTEKWNQILSEGAYSFFFKNIFHLFICFFSYNWRKLQLVSLIHLLVASHEKYNWSAFVFFNFLGSRPCKNKTKLNNNNKITKQEEIRVYYTIFFSF